MYGPSAPDIVAQVTHSVQRRGADLSMALSLAPLSTSKPADGHLLAEEELHKLLEACDLVAAAHDVDQHQRRPKRHCRTSLGVEQIISGSAGAAKTELENSELRLRGKIRLFQPENRQIKSPETEQRQAKARNFGPFSVKSPNAQK